MLKNKTFYIKINNKKVSGKEGQTILEVARDNKIEIPALCQHPDLEVKANCRICVVEIKGRRGLHTSCSTKVEPGMEVITNSAKISKARRINLELIFSQHVKECRGCVWSYNCELKKLAEKYNFSQTRFKDRKAHFPKYDFGPSIHFDASKCIDCRNCVDVCAKQGVNFLEVKEKGHLFQVVPTKNEKSDCIYCGQCITHCPVGAIETVKEIEPVEKLLKDKSKVVVFQFAPSIRASIGEEFGLPYGSIVTDKLVAAIRQLEPDAVFDVAVGADFTTMEEAKELVERIKENKKLPMFTSCCPGWVKYVEFFEPKIIPLLTSVRSPHVLMGGLIKTYWAETQKIDPKKIRVVSIMPCTAKKYEVRRPQLIVRGMQMVDQVLTTRELAHLLHKHKINLATIKPEKADVLFGNPSGAGVIYGASGGVMESALRTAYYEMTGKNLAKIDLKAVRGMAGCKKAEIKINDKIIKVAVVNGTANAQKILDELKVNPNAYHYVEVMACFGGCIGGGGQPVPSDTKIRQKRALSLYSIDTKKKLRRAHDNPILKKAYKTYFTSEEKIHEVMHTSFAKKNREVNY